jgi:2-polyprenyl-3-methyl-5-hydroxy-6-metoxy-1,4-benzoquinol methylase
MTGLACRFCAAPLTHVFADLGVSPLANSFVEESRLATAEPVFPLTAYVCESCFLVQLPEFEEPQEIFSDYAYFSSYSATWLEHARRYSLEMIERLDLDAGSQVVEIASNDGYLLKNFKEKNIPVLGIEPAANVARVALDAGIPTRVEFFGTESARRLDAEGTRADLLLGNNVLAHVPDLNDFVAGLALLLAPHGTLTLEFPHLLRLIAEHQFDTIYHEHFSYFSLATARRVLAAHGLRIVDVQQLSTHGGSLRVFAIHDRADAPDPGPAVGGLLDAERRAGLERLECYLAFDGDVRATKRRLLRFLIELKDQGATIVGYGAPAKGNTLLNFCGIGRDFLEFTVDKSPHKQGRYLPGTRVPIRAPEAIRELRPDYVLVLPWNLKEEIMQEMSDIRSWGGRFIVAIPEIRVY